MIFGVIWKWDHGFWWCQKSWAILKQTDTVDSAYMQKAIDTQIQIQQKDINTQHNIA